MEYSKKLQEKVNQQIRSNLKLESQIDKEIDYFCQCYRDWYQAETKSGHKPISILAEGDSWFRYIIGKGIIYYLENELETDILNLAFPGDEAREILSAKQKKRIIKELKAGPKSRQKFDYFLFSAGGNDLVGVDRFHKWLNDYQKGMSPKALINHKNLKAAFSLLQQDYQELIDIRDQYSPKTQLIFHNYDFAIPDGRGVCGLGPWLKPDLEMRKIPVRLRREVVTLFLKEFAKLLKRIAKQNTAITIVQTQGTLKDSEWANELHPTNRGFKQLAKCFVPCIN